MLKCPYIYLFRLIDEGQLQTSYLLHPPQATTLFDEYDFII